jgi:hypothetical protein
MSPTIYLSAVKAVALNSANGIVYRVLYSDNLHPASGTS